MPDCWFLPNSWLPACTILPLAIDFSCSGFYLPHLSPEEPVVKHLAAPGWMLGHSRYLLCSCLISLDHFCFQLSEVQIETKRDGKPEDRCLILILWRERWFCITFCMTPQWVPHRNEPQLLILTFPPPLLNSPLSFTPESGIISQINTCAHILALGFAFEMTWTKTGSSENP